METSARTGLRFFLSFGKKSYFVQRLSFLVDNLFGNVFQTSGVIGLISLRETCFPYFSLFEMYTESYGVNLGIKSEHGKIRARKKLRIWTLFTQ